MQMNPHGIERGECVRQKHILAYTFFFAPMPALAAPPAELAQNVHGKSLIFGDKP